jgi:hypothetical protein
MHHGLQITDQLQLLKYNLTFCVIFNHDRIPSFEQFLNSMVVKLQHLNKKVVEITLT